MGKLVISRKQNESVQIGAEITVTVGEIDRGKVRLVIDAPDHIDIRRDDLPADYRRKDKGNDRQ